MFPCPKLFPWKIWFDSDGGELTLFLYNCSSIQLSALGCFVITTFVSEWIPFLPQAPCFLSSTHQMETDFCPCLFWVVSLWPFVDNSRPTPLFSVVDSTLPFLLSGEPTALFLKQWIPFNLCNFYLLSRCHSLPNFLS
jgi:hypothetical protein